MVRSHTLLIGQGFYPQMGNLTRSTIEQRVVLGEARGRAA